jgi:hypothetical protein
MDFIKNINEEFILTNFNFLKEIKNYSLILNENILAEDVLVSVTDINKKEVFLKIINIGNIDNLIEDIANIMCKKLIEYADDYKLIASKIIKSWEDSPEKFILQKNNRDNTFKNLELLTNDEYIKSVSVFFGKLYYSGFYFTTGWGDKSFYNKDYYINNLNEIDAWLAKSLKDIKSSKTKPKIKNEIYRNIITIPLSDTNKYLILNEKEVTKNSLKPKFPIAFNAEELNTLISSINSHVYITDDIIEDFNSEDIDISKLKDWEISYSHDGYHHNDGQICDYEVIFTSPEGYNYYLYDSHSLITGWNFYGEIDIV